MRSPVNIGMCARLHALNLKPVHCGTSYIKECANYPCIMSPNLGPFWPSPGMSEIKIFYYALMVVFLPVYAEW